MFPTFKQVFPADGYYSSYRQGKIFQYAFSPKNAPFAGSKNNIMHKWRGDIYGSGGSVSGDQQRAEWNLKEYGTHKIANQQYGWEYPTHTMKQDDSLNTHVNDQKAVVVYGEVRDMFDSNDNGNAGSHTIGASGVGNRCVSLQVVDSTYRSGMFFFSGLKTPMVYPAQTSGPISFNVADCDCSYLEDVSGVSFDYSYLGSHGDAKNVHPYIKSVYMLYATHNYSNSDDAFRKELYMFTRKASHVLSGNMDTTPSDKDHVNNRDYHVAVRISDEDRAHLVRYGMMGRKIKKGRQQRAYWMGVAMRIEFPKKNTATVTRTINISAMRPIITLDGSYTNTKPLHWAIGKDKRMFTNNNVFYDANQYPNRPFMNI